MTSGFGTKCVHAGILPDPQTGAVVTPLSLSTTFQQTSPGHHSGFEYSRSGNPTRKVFQDNIASLEKGSWALAFASGSATLNAIANLLNHGQEVICMDDVYGGTFRYFSNVGINNGIKFRQVDFRDKKKLSESISPDTKLLWLETPSNPLLKIVDIEAISKIAKSHNITFVVDNTFLSPYFQTPLDLGADLVVHSVTKYLNGHSDVVMGVVCGRDQELFHKLKYLQNAIGAVPSPFDCWLALRGVKTLHVRMRAHENNAIKVAQFLSQHPKVETVLYPGLASHPDHEVALKQMRGFGGMVTFYLKGQIAESRRFLENVKLWALAESLGAVESLVDHPAIMTHASVPPEERARLGLHDNLIRLSVGIEDIEDLLFDLGSALDHV
eukprot:TRINITY_DN7821_c0_g1_i1.p1 TRINITY_DN7821_c0_g1~~TRINITY_DN7821_c0_g1_i1.p1  ORF type:complete len:383 (-),score=54.14 TRINITY_DN7821_c0_g1_i1:82-1230(-)